MNILILLLGTSVGVALLFLAAFFWASQSGQYDDTVTPAQRILLDGLADPSALPLPPTTVSNDPSR